MPAKTRTRGFVNIRMRPTTHDTLKAVASARGIALMELLDEWAQTFETLVAPLRAHNGEVRASTDEKAC